MIIVSGACGVVSVSEIEKGKTVEDFDRWSYEYSYSRLDLTFDQRSHRLIDITCFSGNGGIAPAHQCPPLMGISDGNTEQELVDTLGAPDSSTIDGVTKTMLYKNAHFYLTK